MQILLLSMPDSFEHTPTIAIRMPNGALASLAGNVDPQHQVAIADLVLVQSSVHATVVRLIEQLQPRLVGLSVMTFQRSTARRIISLIRAMKPDVLVAVGGYDPSSNRRCMPTTAAALTSHRASSLASRLWLRRLTGRPSPAAGRNPRDGCAWRGSYRCDFGRGFDSRRLHL